MRTLDDIYSGSLARQRFSATIIVVFAGSALAQAMVGLYGVIALHLGQRRREIDGRRGLTDPAFLIGDDQDAGFGGGRHVGDPIFSR